MEGFRYTNNDRVCLPRLLLCMFQLTSDLEVPRPKKERMGARKGCCLEACVETATLVARGCWQEISYEPCPSSPLANEHFPLLSAPLAERRQPSSAERSDRTVEPLRPLRADTH